MKIESKIQRASKWLLNELTINEGTGFVTDILFLAKMDGITEITLRRARAKFNIVSRRVGFGRGARWFWELLDDNDPKGNKKQ